MTIEVITNAVGMALSIADWIAAAIVVAAAASLVWVIFLIEQRVRYLEQELSKLHAGLEERT